VCTVCFWEAKQNNMCAKPQRAYVTMNSGKIFLIGEGYPLESSVSPQGPQQVVPHLYINFKSLSTSN
jgi:hypothetical protein